MTDEEIPKPLEPLTLQEALREQGDADATEMEAVLAQVAKMSDEERRRELVAYEFLADERASDVAATAIVQPKPAMSPWPRLSQWLQLSNSRLILGVGVAASLAASIGLVILLQHSAVDDAAGPVYRGDDGRQVLRTKNPDALADTIVKELNSLSMPSKLSVFGDVTTLEVTWPDKPTVDQTRFLQKHGLRAKPGTTLAVEIRREGR